jgi:hypothetical protein
MGLVLSFNEPNLPSEILVSCRPVLFPASTLYQARNSSWRVAKVSGAVGPIAVRFLYASLVQTYMSKAREVRSQRPWHKSPIVAFRVVVQRGSRLIHLLVLQLVQQS